MQPKRRSSTTLCSKKNCTNLFKYKFLLLYFFSWPFRVVYLAFHHINTRIRSHWKIHYNILNIHQCGLFHSSFVIVAYVLYLDNYFLLISTASLSYENMAFARRRKRFGHKYHQFIFCFSCCFSRFRYIALPFHLWIIGFFFTLKCINDSINHKWYTYVVHKRFTLK